MSLYKKISEVMKDIEYLQKDDKVSVGQGNGYKAISEEKVTMTVRESLIKRGLVILPVEQEHLREALIGSNGDHKGYLTTVNTKYEIVDIETGESKVIVSSGTGSDTQDKGVGKAMTYSYKYLLLRTFGIPTGDDPDKVSSADLDASAEREQKKAEKKTEGNPYKTKTLNEIKTAWVTKGYKVNAVDAQCLRLYQIKLADLSEQQLQDFLEKCKAMPKREEQPA